MNRERNLSIVNEIVSNVAFVFALKFRLGFLQLLSERW